MGVSKGFDFDGVKVGSEREVYDYLANSRLKDRLLQTFMEMNVEFRITDRSVGIDGPAKLPPDDLVSPEEGHAEVSLSEILGYSIVDDMERPGGLRLLEWVRGYAVLKELGQAYAHDEKPSGGDFAPVFSEAELLDILERCGLERAVAAQFIDRAVLHKSSRDMFDCPLVRLQDGNILLFAPAVIDVNIPLVVLSNLSNRGEGLSRKGKAFEAHVRDVFRRNNIEVFAFKATRNGQQFEYDAVVAWGDYIFIFECKNRTLSGNDPAQTYYFGRALCMRIIARRMNDSCASSPAVYRWFKSLLQESAVPLAVAWPGAPDPNPRYVWQGSGLQLPENLGACTCS